MKKRKIQVVSSLRSLVMIKRVLKVLENLLSVLNRLLWLRRLDLSVRS